MKRRMKGGQCKAENERLGDVAPWLHLCSKWRSDSIHVISVLLSETRHSAPGNILSSISKDQLDHGRGTTAFSSNGVEGPMVLSRLHDDR